MKFDKNLVLYIYSRKNHKIYVKILPENNGGVLYPGREKRIF